MDLTVCRLHAGRDAITDRILRRGRGEGPAIPGDELKGLPEADLHRLAARAADEAVQLQRIQFGDLSVDTDGRTVEEIARRIAP